MFDEDGSMWEKDCWIWKELDIKEEDKRWEATEEFRPSSTFL
jgi:hypothetical protein